MISTRSKHDSQKGALLLEVLFVTVAAAIIVGISAQIIVTTLRGGSVSVDRQILESLKSEAFEAIRADAHERWRDLYELTKGSANHYYPAQTGNRWTFQEGDENVIINGVSYTRYFYVESVSRDQSSRDLETIYNATNDDPSTQLVTVIVQGPSGNLTSAEYLERWRNKVCDSTTWSGVGLTPAACPNASYGSSSNIDFSTAGSLKLSPQ